MTLADPGSRPTPDLLPSGGGRRVGRRSAIDRRWWVGALLAVALLTVAIVGWLLHSSSGHAHTTAPVAVPTTAAAAPAGPPVVTPAQAAAVVRRFWPAHEKALAHHDLHALASMTAGPARAWEQAVVACGCRGVTAPRRVLRANYFVPRQAAYPASFIAAVMMDKAAGYATEILVFTQTAAGRPWLLTEDSLQHPHYGTYADLVGPAAASPGFAATPTKTQHEAATKVVSQLAGLWQETKDNADIPNNYPFDLTGPTLNRLSYLAKYQQDSTQANGLLGHFTFTASPDEHPVEVGVAGYDLACQPLHETVVYEAPAGSAIVQDAARHNWGPALAPGRYGAVVSQDVWQTCFFLPPDPTQSIQVFNQDVGGPVVTVYRGPAVNR